MPAIYRCLKILTHLKSKSAGAGRVTVQALLVHHEAAVVLYAEESRRQLVSVRRHGVSGALGIRHSILPPVYQESISFSISKKFIS